MFGLPDRYWRHVRASDLLQPGACWNWDGKASAGYGRYAVIPGAKTAQVAHRVAYEAANGPVPKGLELDHLCRNKLCVNPDHLEAVTHRENTLRVDHFPIRNLTKTECDNGHPFDEANTYRHKNRRQCRACNREAVRRYKERAA